MTHRDFDDLAEQLTALSQVKRSRQLVPRHHEGIYLIGPDGRRLLNFGGNDYLGLAAENVACNASSPGSGASALVCGWTAAHQQLANTIAEFESTESAVVFPSGYAACMGTVATLAQQRDLILSDQLNHASLIDGCRLSRAACLVYPHRDYRFVRDTLQDQREQFQRVWIVTDGVFSMDGHVAPLVELSEIAEQFAACLIVDEAHGTGVLGDRGSGVCEALDVKDRVAIRIGTLSKAIGSQGGFVAGPKIVIDFLINHCRALIFSTALAPPAVVAASAAIQCIVEQPQRRQRVQNFARQLRSKLQLNATNAIESGVPIIPVIVGSDQRTVAISKCLAERGFYVPAIRPPTVPEGTARLRISLSANHEEVMIAAIAEEIMDLV
jgi:8-amino-7-oxononanoate synthase